MKNSTLHIRIDAKTKKAAIAQAAGRGVTLTFVVERFLELYGQGDLRHEALLSVKPGRIYRQLKEYWKSHPKQKGKGAPAFVATRD